MDVDLGIARPRSETRVVVAMSGMDDVVKSTIWRKRVESAIALILQTPETQGPAPAIARQDKDERGNIVETLKSGMILRTGPGETASTLNPSASADTVDFVRSLMYGVCAACGLTYHEVSGDVSQANYSSLRAATLSGYVIIDMVQWLIVVPRERRAWRRVMKREALRLGRPELADVRAEWAMPARPWVDPVKEVSAKIAEIRAGLQSMPDALGERGVDWRRQLLEIQDWLQTSDAVGVVLDTDPRKVAGSGALQRAAQQYVATDE